MKHVLFPLIALALFPMAAGADTLQQRVQNQVAAQRAVKHPEFFFFGLKQAFAFPKYRNFLFEQVDVIMGKAKTSISLSALMQQAYFKREFAGLSDKQREKLAEIATKDDAPDMVSEPELLAMLVLLDANLEMNNLQKKELFKMDTFPSLGEKGGLLNAYPSEIESLVKNAKGHTRAIEKQREQEKAALEAKSEQDRAAAQAEKAQRVRAELQQLQVFEEDGSLNAPAAARAVTLLRDFAGNGEEAQIPVMAKIAFKAQLKSASWTQTRSNDVDVILKDGTKLESREFGRVVIVTYPDGSKENIYP